MSMASPTLRSSSSTLPWPSCSSWATERLARPSTAEMLTGTSKTGARSAADFPSLSTCISEASFSSAANSSSVRLVSSAIVGLVGGNQGFGMQTLGGEGRVEGGRHAFGGGLGIESRLAVAPVEDEGGGGQRGVGPGGDLAGEADRLGGLVEGRLDAAFEAGGDPQ